MSYLGNIDCNSHEERARVQRPEVSVPPAPDLFASYHTRHQKETINPKPQVGAVVTWGFIK